MDNLNIKFRFFFTAAVVCMILLWGFFATNDPVAFADGEYLSGEVNVTADFLQGTSGATPVLSTYPYGDKADAYRKNVRAEFTVYAPYYRFVYTVDGETRAPGNVLAVPDGGKVTFEANETGVFVVTCEAFIDPLGEAVESCSCTFKNDRTVPEITGNAAAEMTGWRHSGQEYVVSIDWSVFSDSNSGLYGFCYFLRYDNGTDTEVTSLLFKNADTSAVTVTGKGTLWLVAIDTAGNALEVSYRMEKFDDVKPPVPQYAITPEISDGKYAGEYEISVTFSDDNAGGSGLAQTQHYRINGESRAFEASLPTPESIILNRAADYHIVLYAVDNAGNVSDERVIDVPFSAFDVTPPNIADIIVSFDLSNADGICSITADVTDSGESGVKNVYLEGKNVTLRPSALSTSSKQIAYFDCFGYGPTVTLTAEDEIGRSSSVTLMFPYFTDVDINEGIKRVVALFRATNKDAYTDTMWSSLQEGSTKICNLLRLENASKTEIMTAISSLSAMFEEKIKTSYTILSVPDFVSTGVTFTVAESDMAGYKYGTTVSMEMAKGQKQSTDYVSRAGFNSGFTDFFDLAVKLDGEELETPFTTGLSVSMTMPNGYFDRKVALFDVATGEKVNTEQANNTLVFTVKASSQYALVIEGGKAPMGSNETEVKTITVFDRKIEFTKFLWIVGGCAGAAVLLIILIIVIGFFKG